MNKELPTSRVPWMLIAIPIGIYAGYISWLIVPVVVQKVVPAVIRAIFGA